MSINISSKLARYTSSIVGIIDTSTFGPRQQSNYTNMCRSGVMLTDSIPAIAAYNFRRSQHLGTVFINKRRVLWNEVTDNDFFDRLIAGIVAAKLNHVDISYTWVNKYLDEALDIVSTRTKAGECYLPTTKTPMKTFFKTFSLEVYSGLIPVEVPMDILHGAPL